MNKTFSATLSNLKNIRLFVTNFLNDYELEIKLVNNIKKPDGVKSKLMNSSLSKKFGWRANIKLDNGLNQTISWYIKNYQKTT